MKSKKIEILNGSFPYKKYDNDEKTEEIEKLLEKNVPEFYDVLIQRNDDWDITDALSEIRRNCIGWIPFSSNDKVLEIGSVYGNTTEFLAEKVGEIHCLEVSMAKCRLTASRLSACSNATVFLGGIDDLAEQREEKYDYIVLVGTFSHIGEYFSDAYNGEKNLQLKAAAILGSMLSDRGRIVVAEDNRLGLKYWRGDKLNTSDDYFSPLNGDFSNGSGVLLTKKELNELFERTGFKNFKYFYPYPDYKYTSAVYSDSYLPKAGELNNNVYNWEPLCSDLFSESKVFDSIISEGLVDRFFNSYVVLISKGTDSFNDINTVYVKYSNDRSLNFKIKTEIKENEKKEKIVYKLPTNRFSDIHLKKMPLEYSKFSSSQDTKRVFLNKCINEENGISCEFIDGVSLSDIAESCLENNDMKGVSSIFDELFDELSDGVNDYFSVTIPFKRVFGNAALPNDMIKSKYSNADFILQNILVTDDKKWTVIDYEWTFDFDIPMLYVLWRSIFYCQRKTGHDNSDEWRSDLFKKFKITAELQETFWKMEANFQKYISHGTVPLRKLKKNENNIEVFRKPIEYFLDFGDGFSSYTKFKSPYSIAPDGSVNLTIPFHYNEVKRIRIDPDTNKCFIKILSVTNGYGEKVPYTTNCTRMCGEENYLFLTTDPQIIIDNTRMLVDKLVVKYIIKDLPNDFTLDGGGNPNG